MQFIICLSIQLILFLSRNQNSLYDSKFLKFSAVENKEQYILEETATKNGSWHSKSIERRVEVDIQKKISSVDPKLFSNSEGFKKVFWSAKHSASR